MIKDRTNRAIQAWCLYDWAISGFQTTIVGAILPIYFRQVSCFTLAKNHFATSIWGFLSALAMLGVAVVSLILGPVSDYTGLKKRMLGTFTAIGIVFTAAIAFLGPGQWVWLSLVFVIASIAAAGSEVFYDSLLPYVAAPNQLNRISARGYATGYLGGGLLLAINVALIISLPKTEIAGKTIPLLGMQLSFFSVAIWWGLFSIPLFLQVRESAQCISWPGRDVLGISIRRLRNTFKDIRRYRTAFMLLLAFWFYNDGIGTVIKMATAYGDEIGIGMNDLIGAFLMVQFIGIPCTLLFGKLSDRIGAKSSILIGLTVYLGISIGGFFMQKAIHFWILAGLVGLVQGGTQALSRSLYAAMIPKKKSAEFFSFFTISGKFAGIIGPALFALVSQFFHNSRYSILSLIFFFIAGGVILIKVPEPRPTSDQE
jgi:UMF1 family MFS transporter